MKTTNKIKVLTPWTKNQFVIEIGNNLIFQSYKTNIALYNKENEELLVSEGAFNRSRATNKYLKKFIEDYSTLDYEGVKRKHKS